MKFLFYTGLVGFILFEIARVYFIMPMPGSQEIESIDLAYFLHTHRWLFRSLFVMMMLAGSLYVLKGSYKWVPVLGIIIALATAYMCNFEMNADHMFLQVKTLSLKTKEDNKLPMSAVVLGVVNNEEAKAYPIRFLAYHHQVIDTIGGKPLMITYCNVCRTGRVYEPIVNNKPERFRLVGMDHFNAMFEDATTKSWWRQATGEAITGKLKGSKLTEFQSYQMSLDNWLNLYPDSKIMQSDEASIMQYDSLAKFEVGKSEGDLTRTDSLSWKNKSWVVGIEINKESKAYDWLDLKKQRIINDEIGNTPLFIALASDDRSFVAFERPENAIFNIRNDSLINGQEVYDLKGINIKDPKNRLKPIKAYQEFWHSWKTFHGSYGL